MKAKYLALCFLETTGKRGEVTSSTICDIPKIRNKIDSQKKIYYGRPHNDP